MAGSSRSTRVLDLASERLLAGARRDAVMSPGAYAAVDGAETEVLEAWRVNALAPALLAKIHVTPSYARPGWSARTGRTGVCR